MNITNSNLVSYIDKGTNKYSNNRSSSIYKITIHHSKGIFDLGKFSRLMRESGTSSWNYGIALDGSIGLYVEESHQAWSSSDTNNDQVAVTIVVSNNIEGSPWTISDASYQSLLYLCEDICRRNNISSLVFTGDKNSSNLTMHKWFAADIDCPGAYLESKFPDIVRTVNDRLKSNNTLGRYKIDSPTIIDDNSLSSSITGQQSANQFSSGMLTPYIITISSNTLSVDYRALKSIGICGVMIELGCLYDSIYREKEYKNPKLDSQINSAISVGLPYGLYTIVKARNVEEAKREIESLKIWIQRYSQNLGLWLRLELSASKSINNDIIDIYYSRLAELGLAERIGFYATPDQIAKIDWDKYCDKWYLWLDKHVTNVLELNELLTPEFFVI